MNENNDAIPATDPDRAAEPPAVQQQEGPQGRNTTTFHFSFSRRPNENTNENAEGNNHPEPATVASSANAPNNAAQGGTRTMPLGRNHMGIEELRRRIQLRAQVPPGVTATLNVNGRGIPLSAGRGGRIRIPIRGGRGGGRGPINMNNRPKPNLPKLLPRMLPESQQEFDTQNATNDNVEESVVDDSDPYGPFKCNICYETMQDPCGCGKCSARFCFGCLQRVAELSALQQQQQQQIAENAPLNPPKCPVCRSDVQEIQRDSVLRQRMEQEPPIPCRYSGCEELLKITQVAQHEASACCFVRMQCRYQPFGCPWTGKRENLEHHERQHCHLARVSQLVERHRQAQVEVAQLGHAVAHLHQNVLTNSAVMELQRSRDSQQRSTGNVFQLFQFVHVLTCCTPRFLVSKDAWAAFYVDRRGQATVANFVTFLPTIVLMLKSLLSSYQLMLLTSQTRETEEELLDFLDATLNFLFFVLLGMVIGLCFYGEGSPDKWYTLKVRFPHMPFMAPGTRDTNLLLYSATIAVAANHTIALEISGSILRATLVWVFLCSTSTAFPGIVTGMLTGVNALQQDGPASDEEALQMIHLGKAARPLWQGLCYAPCAVIFGVLPSIDAATLLFLAQDRLKKLCPLGVVPAGDLLSQIPIPALYVYSGARLAIKATEFPSVGWVNSIDFFVVAAFVVATRSVFWRNFKAGINIGTFCLRQSRRRINPASPVIQTEYHGMAISFFALWCVLLGAIAVT